MSKSDCTKCEDDGCRARKQDAGESDEDFLERQTLASRLCRIKSKILVVSGKGGVGKSTVATNLAITLAATGRQVGLLDVDIHGPSIPTFLGVQERSVEGARTGMAPVRVNENLQVMSVGFLLPHKDDALIFRGPMKNGVIKQFIRDVEWGDLDALVVDCPPGTGDEPLSVCQLLQGADGAVIVTTPQEIALADVRKCVGFCRRMDLPILGVIENMSGFVCPRCNEVVDIFKRGGAEKMASEMGIPFLGRIPIDPSIVEASDEGTPYLTRYAGTETAAAFHQALSSILEVRF